MATPIPPPPAAAAAAAADTKVDYLNLPCPIPFEELHREAMMSLKPDLFEGMRFDFTKMLNQKFSLNHSVLMGPTEVPSQSTETIKIPTAHYEFGSTFIDHPRLLLWGRILTDGRLNARVKCDLSENLTFKANAQLTNEPHMSHAMINFDYKGKDYRTQFQLGNGALLGASYIQCIVLCRQVKILISCSEVYSFIEALSLFINSNIWVLNSTTIVSDQSLAAIGAAVVEKLIFADAFAVGIAGIALDSTACMSAAPLPFCYFVATAPSPSAVTVFSLCEASVTQHLSLGGEVFWAGQHRKSGIGYAARYNTDKSVATGQVASTGMVLLSYVQKVSEKVSLASEFMCNYLSRDVTASFGYDYILRQCRLRGKIDSNGCVAAFLEERLNMGLNFILSAELDHRKKDYKFGFGLTVGE
ncbi:Mitochondrial import receptor subunit TOM40-1 [Glycine soja]|uniref:Mitochondrial import receptor subunit TOM40-1 n=1 Tax=Glycine soja TaxID=3848 RepID=A0A445KTI9_GLYSO|nr:Mitochondrial import receptor subunit TOM40-1 [Glycine soja]